MNDCRSFERWIIHRCWVCNKHRHYRNSKFLQANSRSCRIKWRWKWWTQIEKNKTWKSMRKSQFSWAHLIVLTRFNRYREYWRWNERFCRTSTLFIIDQINTSICFQTPLSAIRECNNFKSIQRSWWQSKCVFDALLISNRDFFWHISNDFITIDDEENIDEIDNFIVITSMNPEIDITHFKNFHPKKQPKTYNCWSSFIISKSIIFFFDHSNFHNIALFHDQVDHIILENNRKATTIIYLFHNITMTSSPLERFQVQECLISNEEWKIKKIVDKRQSEKDYEYKVCWKEIWLLECELKNAQELLQKFESQMSSTSKRRTGKNDTCKW